LGDILGDRNVPLNCETQRQPFPGKGCQQFLPILQIHKVHKVKFSKNTYLEGDGNFWVICIFVVDIYR